MRGDRGPGLAEVNRGLWGGQFIMGSLLLPPQGPPGQVGVWAGEQGVGVQGRGWGLQAEPWDLQGPVPVPGLPAQHQDPQAAAQPSRLTRA